jgi:hypothetical protein
LSFAIAYVFQAKAKQVTEKRQNEAAVGFSLAMFVWYLILLIILLDNRFAFVSVTDFCDKYSTSSY